MSGSPSSSSFSSSCSPPRGDETMSSLMTSSSICNTESDPGILYMGGSIVSDVSYTTDFGEGEACAIYRTRPRPSPQVRARVHWVRVVYDISHTSILTESGRVRYIVHNFIRVKCIESNSKIFCSQQKYLN